MFAENLIEGNFIAIELIDNAEFSFHLGMAMGTGIQSQEGNELVEMRRLEPVAVGSTVYHLRDEEIELAPVKQLIPTLVEMTVIVQERHTRRGQNNIRYKISGDELDTVLRNLGLLHEVHF